MTDAEVREKIAALEHEQWMRWAKSIVGELALLTQHHLPYGSEAARGDCGCKTCQRIRRWEKLFIPYAQLTEPQKDQDREEADIVLKEVADYLSPSEVEAKVAEAVLAEQNTMRFAYADSIKVKVGIVLQAVTSEFQQAVFVHKSLRKQRVDNILKGLESRFLQDQP